MHAVYHLSGMQLNVCVVCVRLCVCDQHVSYRNLCCNRKKDINGSDKLRLTRQSHEKANSKCDPQRLKETDIESERGKREQGKKERAHLLSPSSLGISRTIFRVLCLSEIILSVRTLEFACDIRVAICVPPPASHLPLAACHLPHLPQSLCQFFSIFFSCHCHRRETGGKGIL